MAWIGRRGALVYQMAPPVFSQSLTLSESYQASLEAMFAYHTMKKGCSGSMSLEALLIGRWIAKPKQIEQLLFRELPRTQPANRHASWLCCDA